MKPEWSSSGATWGKGRGVKTGVRNHMLVHFIGSFVPLHSSLSEPLRDQFAACECGEKAGAMTKCAGVPTRPESRTRDLDR